MAEMGCFKEAKDIYLWLYSAGFSTTDLLCNAGHALIELSQFDAAVKMVLLSGTMRVV